MNTQGKYADVLLQDGKELQIEVANVNGGDWINGSPITYVNVDANSVPVVTLSQADTFQSGGTGVVTHDILENSYGMVTTFGEVSGLTLADLAETGITLSKGDILYVSALEAGKYTNVAPDRATRIGTVFNAVVGAGVIFVNPEANISLPTIFAGLNGATAPTSLPAGLGTYTPITAYGTPLMVAMVADEVAGTITTPVTGIYRPNISLDLAFDNVGGAGKKEIYLVVRNTTDNTVVSEVKGFILKDAETYSFSGGSLTELTANKAYRLELRSELELTNLTFSQCNFDITSVHIRQ